MIDALRQLYDRYLEQVRQAEQEQGPMDGLLGFGSGLAEAPCHDRFVKDLEHLLTDVAADPPRADEVRELLAYIYWAPQHTPEPLATYWMLMAVQGLTLSLIRQLTSEDAEQLWREYKSTYRRRHRLPAQKQVLKALDQQRKQG